MYVRTSYSHGDPDNGLLGGNNSNTLGPHSWSAAVGNVFETDRPDRNVEAEYTHNEHGDIEEEETCNVDGIGPALTMRNQDNTVVTQPMV
ncbi:hypothetical protein NKR23_g11570 [Pleurostoma richardsiae]|uniref:Uncharacterized protein n=1 Tax=Pleurostoma richardsiae TaxID=41990 RepID=A0AA38R3B8_9PEZI|nr:hypothetical protein NKR23_g11570 [Pleurostoma richardsiae]